MTNISDTCDHKRRANPRTIRTIPAITAAILLLTAIIACGSEGADPAPAGSGNGSTPAAGQVPEQSRPESTGQGSSDRPASESAETTARTTDCLTLDGFDYLFELKHPMWAWFKRNWFVTAIATATFSLSAFSIGFNVWLQLTR